jgi:hypothetical protein
VILDRLDEAAEDVPRHVDPLSPLRQRVAKAASLPRCSLEKLGAKEPCHGDLNEARVVLYARAVLFTSSDVVRVVESFERTGKLDRRLSRPMLFNLLEEPGINDPVMQREDIVVPTPPDLRGARVLMQERGQPPFLIPLATRTNSAERPADGPGRDSEADKFSRRRILLAKARLSSVSRGERQEKADVCSSELQSMRKAHLERVRRS